MSFTPKSLSTPPARAMIHNEEKPFPTFVVQFAYRHQSPVDLRKEAIDHIFSKNTSIQLFLGIKVYDDHNFEYILLRRDIYHWQRASTIEINGSTNQILALPAELLLWGVETPDVKDCILDLENLRYILSGPCSVKRRH